ncbi:hypothetical protein Ndes2526A_g01610 [Nannochloris sp. 'desiccata']
MMSSTRTSSMQQHSQPSSLVSSGLPTQRRIFTALPTHIAQPKREEKRPRLPPCQARRPRDPMVTPVIFTGPNNEEVTDLNSHMMNNRIIFIGSRINDQVAVQVVASLLALNSLDDQSDIKLYINCAAGSSYAVVSILDTMKAINAPISTVAFGMVGGTAVHILAAGDKGKRFSMPNTRIMLQQPNGGAMGSADEVNIQATELNRTMKMMYSFLSDFTGLDMEKPAWDATGFGRLFERL